MSQLFDSLRRGGQGRSRQKLPHTAHGDAVLATLGYAPSSRAGGFSAYAVPILLLGGALAAGWVAWNIHRRPDSPVRQEAPRFAASRSAAATPAPVVGAQRRDLPVTTALPTAPAAQLAAASTSLRSEPVRTERGEPGHSTPPSASPVLAVPPATPRSIAAVPVPAMRAPAATNLDLALYYHRAGDFENALQHYRALLLENELDAQAHNNLGLLYQERGLLQESARELQRALVIEPRNAATHNNYGVTLLKQNRPDEALAEFGAALTLSPRSVDAVVNMALARRDSGQPGLAKETLLRALSIDPQSAAAHYNLAQVYDRENEAARAVEHYRRFLENAGAEHASRVAAVRSRLEVLARGPE